jgi:hypothetical protein
MKHILLALTLLLPALPAFASTVYVESNEPEQNKILMYHLDANGTLTQTGAMPTGGKGFVDPTLALGPFDSDQQVIINSARTLLFAVNSGSNSISVFCILKDGKLDPVKGSPFESHGINPVSVGLRGDILTVVNKHGDPAQDADKSLPNYTNFMVSNGGELKWIAGSTAEVASGSSPSQALTAPMGPFVFGADFLGGVLQSFQTSPNGMLMRRSTLGLPAAEFPNAQTPRLPLGLAAHPSRPLLYVGFPTASKIGVYEYDRTGQLRFESATEDSGKVVCWLAVNKAGTRLYASNTADPSVTIYDLANPAKPREFQKISLASMGGAYQIALSPSGHELLVLTQRFKAETPQGEGNELHVIRLDGMGRGMGEHSAVKLSLPNDVRPQGVATL